MTTATLEAPPAVPWPTDVLVTAEDLLDHPEWGPCELIRGKVFPVCRPNNEHGMLIGALSIRVGGFIERHKLGRFFAGDSGVFLERNPDTLRGPDIHFVRENRWPGGKARKGYLEVPPDLCIEIVSPSDRWTDIEEKIRQYRAIHVKRVWLIDTKTYTARVYRDDGGEEFIPNSGSLSGDEILPGFELSLKELFAVLD